MDFLKFVVPYEALLDELTDYYYFGKYAITHYLTIPELKSTGIKDFYTENALVYRDNILPGDYIDVLKEEHPTIVGGVTEYLTKIKLARQLGKNIEELKFYDDIHKPRYKNLTDEELAFAMYEPDIIYRSKYGYTEEIIEHKEKIIRKSVILADRALKLINETFPKIEQVDFHPEGHVNYYNTIAIKGDSDLVVNNCLIDFKTKKDYKLSKNDRGQLFAYGLHKFMRDGENYDKVFFLNPRFGIIQELVLKD